MATAATAASERTEAAAEAWRHADRLRVIAAAIRQLLPISAADLEETAEFIEGLGKRNAEATCDD